MTRLRFALAILTVALAAPASQGFAFESCPFAIQYECHHGTCGYTGQGTCANKNCQYDCGWIVVTEDEACRDS